jgi:hypothetical protein
MVPVRGDGKPYKGSIYQLVVNLRCGWCKQLFPWRPRYKARIEERLPDCCSERCTWALRDWHNNRTTFYDKGE